MTVPLYGQGPKYEFAREERARFNQLVAHALSPFPSFVDLGTQLAATDLYNTRLVILSEAIEALGSSYNHQYTTNLDYLNLMLTAEKVQQAIPELLKLPYFAEKTDVDLVHRLGVESRRLSQRAHWLTEEQQLEVATLSIACSRFVAVNAFQQLRFLTDNLFLDSGMIESNATKREQLLDQYKQWSDSLDQLMVSVASGRQYSKNNPDQLSAIDQVLTNLEKLRVYQKEKVVDMLTPRLLGGRFEAEMILVLQDIDKVNRRASENPGATMDLKSFRQLHEDFENNCTRTSVSTVHRLGGANVRAGAVATDGSSKDTQTYAIHKFAKIYGNEPMIGWKTKDGKQHIFQTCQDVLKALENEYRINGVNTALIQWQYKDSDFGHVTAATIIDGKAVIIESQDRSLISVSNDGQLTRHTIDPDDPTVLSNQHPFELNIERMKLVLVPSTPTLNGKPCSHRAKCEQASEIMAQSWTDRFGPSPKAQSASR